MNHKWERLPDKIYDYMPNHKQWLCKVCGCKKIVGNYKFAEPRYDRSGQMYDHYIECIDEEFEKTKTID